MNSMKSKRNSNIEMLRIIAMFMIIGHHYRVWSTAGGVDYSVNSFVGVLFNMGGKYGVDLFVIISSYFLVDSKFKFNRIIRTWAQTWSYSVFFLIVTLIFNASVVSGKTILMSILPISYKNYWYVTAYIGLLIISPYLNILFRNVTKKQHLMLVLILTSMYFLWPSILIKSNTYFSHLGMFITIYTIISYLKKHYKFKLKTSTAICGSGTIYLLIFLGGCCFTYLGEVDPGKKEFWEYCKVSGFSEYSILLLISAILLFYAFASMPVRSNKIIDRISHTTFGIYLIHDNCFFREVLWGELLRTKDYLYSSMYFVYSLIAIIVVFVISMCIEMLFEKLWEICKIKNLLEKVERKFDYIWSKCNESRY